ncbi:HMA2 domain-containing protein [Desulfatiglans anilini]|uniref:HMA2 domain-containing protein n=1 Tax=Desulfatiglans anilini TaxID=90728 RepID=UPI00042A0F31|nr:hypothetical protein [Desulfatiglans anilini]
MSVYIHSIPGRLRVKIPMLKAQPGLSERLTNELECLIGIDHVAINPVTGSVKIRYRTNILHVDEILACLERSRLLDSRSIGTHANPETQISGQVGVAVGKALFGWAVGKALEPAGLSFLAALI